jgi:hypothetical protein
MLSNSINPPVVLIREKELLLNDFNSSPQRCSRQRYASCSYTTCKAFCKAHIMKLIEANQCLQELRDFCALYARTLKQKARPIWRVWSRLHTSKVAKMERRCHKGRDWNKNRDMSSKGKHPTRSWKPCHHKSNRCLKRKRCQKQKQRSNWQRNRPMNLLAMASHI